MARMTVREALKINERDTVKECRSCYRMPDEGEVYCCYCKDYWENDVPRMNEIADAELWDQ